MNKTEFSKALTQQLARREEILGRCADIAKAFEKYDRNTPPDRGMTLFLAGACAGFARSVAQYLTTEKALEVCVLQGGPTAEPSRG